MVSGALNVTWAEDCGSFEYAREGKLYRFDVGTGETTLLPGEPPDPMARYRRMGGPERGRQFESAESPDGTMKAFYQDRNLFLSAADGSGEIQLTTDGSVEARIKNGSASWVYGEELRQNTAMWWSPDGTKLAYYRFDESGVKDFYLQLNQTQIQDSLGHRGLPQGRKPQPCGGTLRLRPASEDHHPDRRPGREALHQRCRWALRLRRGLVTRRNGDPLQPDEPTTEHHGVHAPVIRGLGRAGSSSGRNGPTAGS